ncbi:hypothetical protein IG631_08175 [Alternaria alternata]|nr:hypothetical protein IG631_08175 [Alternaria alternata]
MKGSRTKMRAEFWKVSYERISLRAYTEHGHKDLRTVTRDRCFIDTPPRVPEAALTTIVGSALVEFAGKSGNR